MYSRLLQVNLINLGDFLFACRQYESLEEQSMDTLTTRIYSVLITRKYKFKDMILLSNALANKKLSGPQFRLFENLSIYTGTVEIPKKLILDESFLQSMQNVNQFKLQHANILAIKKKEKSFKQKRLVPNKFTKRLNVLLLKKQNHGPIIPQNVLQHLPKLLALPLESVECIFSRSTDMIAHGAKKIFPVNILLVPALRYFAKRVL